MDRQIDGVIASVDGRHVTRKSDNQQFMLYEVTTENGMKATTSKRELAEQAFDLKGKPAVLVVKDIQKGEYTNHYLQSVYPNPGLKSLQEASQQALGASENFKVPTTMYEPALPSPALPQASRDIPIEEPTQKNTFIWRQTAAKVSAQISDTSDEFWSNLDSLVTYFETGNKPKDQLAGVAPEGASDAPDDDIPF